MSQYKISDNGDLRNYFTQIPNIIDDSNLSVYSFRLYAHLKRVAGDSGKCWQNTTTLSKECNMSTASISRSKKELVELGFINIVEKKGEHGGRQYHEITIVDIWDKNISNYKAIQSQVTVSNLQGSPQKLASYPGAIKEELFKEDLKEEIPTSFKNPFVDRDFCVKTYKDITGFTLDWENEKKMVTNIESAFERRNMELPEFITYLKGVHHNWCGTKTKDGRLYSPSNPTWIEWAIAGRYLENKDNVRQGKEKGFYA